MTNQEAVKLIDETARFIIWSDGPCGWVKGKGWETKIASNEELAWKLAVSQLSAIPSCNFCGPQAYVGTKILDQYGYCNYCIAGMARTNGD